MNRIVHLTNHRGSLLTPREQITQPEPDSVVLTQGLHGTAWQRYASDGLWHSTNNRVATWDALLNNRNVVLVYDALTREAVS